MKILLVTQFFSPETAAAANRLSTMIGVLSQEHEVTVATLNPSYPSPDFFNEKDVVAHDVSLGYELVRFGTFEQEKGSLLKRGAKEYKFAIDIYRATKNHFKDRKFDVILTSSPSMFLGVSGWLLANYFKARFVWDIRDVTWQYAKQSVNKGILFSVVSSVLERHMAFLLKKADIILGATIGICDTIKGYGVSPGRVVVVPNGISETLYRALCNFPNRDLENKQKVVTYVGVVGLNQGLITLVEAAQKLENYQFKIIGDGVEMKQLETFVKENKLSNVDFKGFLPREEVIEEYKKSDILFAQLKDNDVLNNTAIPSKIFEYLSTGKSIVYAGKGAAAEVLKNVDSATVAEPESVDSIVDAILKVKTDSLAGRKLVEEKYLRENIFSKVNDVLKQKV